MYCILVIKSFTNNNCRRSYYKWLCSLIFYSYNTWSLHFFTKIEKYILAVSLKTSFNVKEYLWWRWKFTYMENWKGESCDRCKTVSASRTMSGWWELRFDQHLHRTQYSAKSYPSLGIHPLVSPPHCGDVALSQCGRPLQHQPFVTIRYLSNKFICLFYSCCALYLFLIYIRHK